jgi:hypothetical protein
MEKSHVFVIVTNNNGFGLDDSIYQSLLYNHS